MKKKLERSTLQIAHSVVITHRKLYPFPSLAEDKELLVIALTAANTARATKPHPLGEHEPETIADQIIAEGKLADSREVWEVAELRHHLIRAAAFGIMRGRGA